MKKYVIILFFTVLTTFSFGNNHIQLNESYIENIDYGDCTVKVEGTFEGVEVDLEITISDVPWLKCQAFRILAKKKLAEMAD